MAIATVNPTNGIEERRFEPHGPADVEAIVDRAHATTAVMAEATLDARAGWLRRAADLLDAEVEAAAALASTEMGKTIGSARFEVTKSARGMRYYADHAAEYLADDRSVAPGDVGASDVRVVHEPLGTILAVMPWNYPFWQVIRFAAPALMAGNTVLLKHASSVPQCALYLGALFERGGFPAGAFQTLLIEAPDVARLLDDARIRAVTLTGSVGAGASIAVAAGRNVKKSVLELGGTDAFIVMPSADLDRAVEMGVAARVQNSGQSCIAAKRFFVHAAIYADFERRFVERMRALVPGDPFDPATSFGPLATEAIRGETDALVRDARARGATVLVGGVVPEGPGWFYPATALSGVTPGMRIHGEECFGPVATLFPVAGIDEAIARANEARFGLSSSVWTTDEDEIEASIRGIQAGAVFVNGNTASFPQLPFGGIKDSGYGRELAGLGIREFTNVKTVWRA